MKKVRAVLFVTVFALVMSIATAVLADTVITIYHTNDIHGRFEPTNSAIGIDTVAAIVAGTENAILVDAGDTIHGLPFVQFIEGMNAVRLMNIAGYSFFTPGNHEFNYGVHRLVELEAYMDFQILSANVFWADSGELIFNAYATIEIDGVTLGFFGLTTPDTPIVTHPRNVANVYFGDTVPAAEAAIEALQAAGADVIIAITHLGDEGSNYTSVGLANAVEGIHLIVDGHSHNLFPEGLLVNDTLIVMAHEHLTHVGRVEIVVSEDGEVALTATVIDHETARENFEPVAAVTALIEEMQAEVEDIGREVVGFTPIYLDGSRPGIRIQEMPLGNLVAGAMAYVSDAQLAIMNSGGIRESIEAGDITVGSILATLAFPNTIIAVEITPAVLWAAMENSVYLWPVDAGRFPQIYGFAFEFDGYAEAGNRVRSITVNGQELDQNDNTTILILAINDFMAAGGDGFSMFVDLNRVLETGVIGSEAFLTFLPSVDFDTVGVEGRIVQVGVEAPVVYEVIVIYELPAPEPAPELPVIVVGHAGSATVANCAYLNVRSAPETADENIIGALRVGTVVWILESVGPRYQWHRIQHGEGYGWIWGRYLEFN